MILATHAIVGAAVASQIPNHPITALVAGIASHFAIDAIPHWDYPLRSMLRGSKGSPLTLDKGLLVDFSLIAIDGLAGLAIALSLFAQPSALLTILLGALGGMLPDAFQFVHRLYPRERSAAWAALMQNADATRTEVLGPLTRASEEQTMPV